MPETSSEPAPVVDSSAPGSGGYQPAAFDDAFRVAKHALAHASIAVFARHGVYEGQQFVLRALWREDGLAPGQIARQLGLATPTVTRAATRMEAAGLLRREPHPTDGRLVRLWLTARGRDLEQIIGPEMSALTERTLAGFSDAERAVLVDALQRIARNLSDG
ncbi:MAG TPA: MarR family transcriptional regulator [Trebonia sp.]|jgi:DNA-binding MarR family transcriptional regulator|nr:MarR family transcriptional regulator [Trebonia sp.]